MKKINKIIITALFGFSLLLSSCGGGAAEEIISCNPVTVADSAQKLITLASDFSSAPTEAKCIAYKKAINNYIDKFEDCPDLGLTQQQINQFRNQLANTNCSDL